ncbi:MFS transporter [Francisella sp. 19X1-34]|uniref:MFS transporter n=1 Tax=Francisella sp. 19X1-34 TaxID=3087177 RepID=UPI002E35D208|nr:MFS transporter [Francisella sp. 19X1-34]MED7787881.1 MFS transporter [Francisella sp. 19X1-34]
MIRNIARSPWVKVMLIVNFCLFSIIANTEGPAITAAIKYYHTSYQAASYLPVVRDGLNLLVSLSVFGVLIKLGYRRSLIGILVIIGIGCLIFPFINSFTALLVLFAIIGALFALTKLCIYTLVTTVTNSKQEYASTISLVEGFYMTAQCASFWIFGTAIHYEGQNWVNLYWLFTGIAVVVIILWLFVPTDETKVREKQISIKNEYKEMFKLIKKPLTLMFLIITAFYLFIEASLLTWLPTFNNQGLHISIALSIYIGSIITASIAIGRLSGAYILKRFKWNIYLLITISLAMIYLIIMIFLIKSALDTEPVAEIKTWGDIPFAAYLFPLIGLLLGPVYPALAAVTLKSVPDKRNAGMMVLLMVFLGIGGISGQKTIGVLFGVLGPFYAFVSLLVPLSILWIVIVIINIFIRKIDSSLESS